MNNYIQKILTKKMNRKEFLVYLGMFFLTVTGVSSLLKNLSKMNFNSKKTIASKNTVKTGFGSSAYGV